VSGLSVFLISLSSVPPLMAMISGAASGSWAIGEPHSEQKRRQTLLPELPLPSYFLTGPLMVSLSLGTTQTRARGGAGECGVSLTDDVWMDFDWDCGVPGWHGVQDFRLQWEKTKQKVGFIMGWGSLQ